MSKFVDLTGHDPSAIYASVRQNLRENTAQKHDIVYVPLPHVQMMRIYDYYHTQEPMINIVNEIKNFHTLGDEYEVNATYGGKEIPDPEKRQVNEALNVLLPEIRAWDDMFGFVGIYDPNAYQDRQIEEIVEDVGGEGGSDTYALRNELMDNVNESIDRLQPLTGDKDADRLKQRVLDRTKIVPDDQEDDTATLRADETDVYIRTEPRISATSAPNSHAIIRERDLGTNDDDGDDDEEQTIVRSRINVRRSLLQTIASISEFRVVNLQEGRFYLEHDRLNGHERVVFARNEDNVELFTKSGEAVQTRGHSTPVTSLNIDEDVYVYVWPGGRPLHNGKLNTRMEEIMRLRDLNAEAEENLSHADRQAAFPTAVYQYQMSRNHGDVTRLTDQQIHFGRGVDEDASLAQRLREEGRKMAEFDAHAQMVNNQRQDELTQRLAGGVERATTVGSDGTRQLRHLQHDKYINLPEGFTYAGVLPSTTLANPTERRHNYRTALASSLGMPLSIIEGGSTFSGGSGGNRTGSSGAAVSTGSAALSSSALVQAIMNDRSRLTMCIGSLYNLMFRDTDNEMLADMLASATQQKRRGETEVTNAVEELRRRLESTNEATERAHIAEQIETNNSFLTAVASRYERIASEVREIASMGNRFEIEFRKMAHVGVDDLVMLKDNFAIDEFTYVNALRQKVGLRAMTSEAELKRNRESALKLHEEKQERELKLQAKYAPAPKQPGGGGGTTGSASKTAEPSAKKRKTESTSSDKKLQEEVKKKTSPVK